MNQNTTVTNQNSITVTPTPTNRNVTFQNPIPNTNSTIPNSIPPANPILPNTSTPASNLPIDPNLIYQASSTAISSAALTIDLQKAVALLLQTAQIQQSSIMIQSARIDQETSPPKTSTTSSSSSSKKSLLDNLTECTQMVIKRGSATEVTDTEPTEFCKTFHELYTSAFRSRAISYMDNSLQRENVRGIMQRGNLTFLLHGGPLWPTQARPEGLTIFSIHPRSVLNNQSGKIRQQEVKASLKVHHDNHLDKEDLEFLVTQGFFFPSNIQEFEIMLCTFISVLGIYFGKDSIIHIAAKTCSKHFFKNQDMYEDQATNSLWLAKVLFAIDNSIQTYLQGLRDDSLPFQDVSFHFIYQKLYQIQNDVLVGRNLNISLPQSLLQLRNDQIKLSPQKDDKPIPKKQKYNNDKKDRTPDIKQKYEDAEPVKNPRPNPKWTIPTGKTFKECFHGNNQKAHPPKHDGKSFCLLFFTCNSCRRGSECKFTHEDPRDVHKQSH